MTEPQPASGSGEHIGPYQIVKILARGGMGEVYLARDDRLNRWVAIKRIRHDSDTPTLRQRLLQEARAVGGLNHPAIVIVYDLLEHEGDDCIVMEYVQGQTLAEALKAGPLEPGLAVRIAEMVASGLAAAHEAGFIHRDLKAENVVVTSSREAKILDFGLAKPIGTASDDPSLTAVGHVVGTCRSMSPEQARGAEMDERSDLFSLGVLLYEMLAGISPFQGSNALATLTRVISERPPCLDTLRPGLPPRLVALVFRLLDKEAAARPQSAAEVVQELHAIATSMGLSGDLDLGETVSALPTDMIRLWGGDPTPLISPPPSAPVVSLQETLPSWRRLEIAVILSLAVVILLAATIIFSFWWRTRPPQITRHAATVHPPVQQAPPKRDHPSPPSLTAPDVSDADLKAFGEIKRRIDAAEAPLKRERRLDQIVERSPHFLEARILAIDVALSLYQSTQDHARLEHAKNLIKGANLDPGDLPLLPSQIKYHLFAGELPEAKRALNRFRKLDRANPFIPELSARLAEKDKRRDDALKEWQLAARLRPVWQNRLRLAKFEQTFGKDHLNEAKQHLEELYKDNKNNIYVLQALAELELHYGNPRRAGNIYGRLIEQSHKELNDSTLIYYINLGTSLVFLGEYDEAARTFKEVLAYDPDSIEATLNLADVENARDHEDAKKLYEKTLELLNSEESGGGQITTDQMMIRAQCLAHLGHTLDATVLAKQTVDQNPTNVTLIQTAALVFALAHDDQALVYIKQAIDMGIQPGWFKLPAYDPLSKNPKYQELVYGKNAAQLTGAAPRGTAPRSLAG